MIYKNFVIITITIITTITLNINSINAYGNKNQNCQETNLYLRCLDGYYKRIKTINTKTKEPIFEGKIRKDDLKDSPFYFKKFTYYSIKYKTKNAIRYEFYNNFNKKGEFYFAFYNNIATLKKAVWYNLKGKIKEVHNYNDRLTKTKTIYTDSFLYYNDFGVLIRKEEYTYINKRLIAKDIDTNFIVENEIFAESEY